MKAARILRDGLGGLANRIRSNVTRSRDASIAVQNPSTLKIERLLSRAKAEVDQILTLGHTGRLENCISLMQLAYTHVDVVHVQDRAQLVRRIADVLEQCHSVGANDIDEPVQSDRPLTFVCSYPRSGNTVAIQLAAAVLQAQVLEGMPNSMIPFSKRIYPKSYPYVRLIKDHVARYIYRRDRVALIVRDGRDCMVSLAFMTLKDQMHDFSNRGELADFIRWLDAGYPFGGWARFMRDAAVLRKFDDKCVLRYEDLMVGPDAFVDFVRFLEPEICLDRDHIVKAYGNRARVFDAVKHNPRANRAWGIGLEFPADSLFYEWSENRQGSSWRQSWDRDAKKAFHETGATQFLMEYGYETDPDWWRQ